MRMKMSEIKKRVDVEKRVFPKFNIASNGCWEWTGATNKKGYGELKFQFSEGIVYLKAHRVFYELFVGEIPEGLEIDHLCRNRKCVNPKHLEPVTTQENIMRGNGLAVLNSRKTCCVNGHPFTPENIIRTKWRNGNGRACRECNRIGGRKSRLKKKLEVSTWQ